MAKSPHSGGDKGAAGGGGPGRHEAREGSRGADKVQGDAVAAPAPERKVDGEALTRGAPPKKQKRYSHAD